MKIKLTISYDGSDFYGSQIQPDQKTIQSRIEELFLTLNIDTKFDFSGRTDKGVHAFRQVVSCTIPMFWSDLNKLKEVLNRQLDGSIYIRQAVKIDDDFHARFSAKKREYRYLISKKQLTPFNYKYMAYYKDIDIKKIEETLKIFIGVHDFEYFSKKGSDPISTIREVYDIKFYEYKDMYVLNFKANSYLRSQIRMMVDFIMKISSGKLTIEDLINQLNKKELISWTLAPSNGLYLSKIMY
ncbi:MAG: tRNA pseudouridine(38-40) synthase TruA [Campylobacterota bacterium]|nr:tRNA pseudouridine(38-40) synthase TruA [Campylobacterota bacterium]